MNKDIISRLTTLEAMSDKDLRMLVTLDDDTQKLVDVEGLINLYLSGAVVAVDFTTTSRGCGMLPELITGLVMEAR